MNRKESEREREKDITYTSDMERNRYMYTVCELLVHYVTPHDRNLMKERITCVGECKGKIYRV